MTAPGPDVASVVGGSGLLGRLVVADLLARGRQVRVLVRDAAAARALLGSQVDVRSVDVRRADGLPAALQGSSTVTFLAHGFLGGRGAGPTAVDHHGAAHVAAAARSVGAAVVMVSVLGAAADSPLELMRAKHAGEAALRRSGAPWTVVRSGPFLETWQQVLRSTAGRSGRPVVPGAGSQPIPFVPVAEVAAVVVRAAVDPAPHGRVLVVAGVPQTMTELARSVQHTAGSSGPPRHVPRALLRTVAAFAPVAPALARRAHTALVMDTVDLVPAGTEPAGF